MVLMSVSNLNLKWPMHEVETGNSDISFNPRGTPPRSWNGTLPVVWPNGTSSLPLQRTTQCHVARVSNFEQTGTLKLLHYAENERGGTRLYKF